SASCSASATAVSPMRLDHVAGIAAGHLFGRIVRRLAAGLFCAVFALVALYHFTAAGTVELEAQYGALKAQLAIGGIYAVVALATAGTLWLTRAKPVGDGNQLAGPRQMQLVMLLEAALLGYTLARKRD